MAWKFLFPFNTSGGHFPSFLTSFNLTAITLSGFPKASLRTSRALAKSLVFSGTRASAAPERQDLKPSTLSAAGVIFFSKASRSLDLNVAKSSPAAPANFGNLTCSLLLPAKEYSSLILSSCCIAATTSLYFLVISGITSSTL